MLVLVKFQTWKEKKTQKHNLKIKYNKILTQVSYCVVHLRTMKCLTVFYHVLFLF